MAISKKVINALARSVYLSRTVSMIFGRLGDSYPWVERATYTKRGQQLLGTRARLTQIVFQLTIHHRLGDLATSLAIVTCCVRPFTITIGHKGLCLIPFTDHAGSSGKTHAAVRR